MFSFFKKKEPKKIEKSEIKNEVPKYFEEYLQIIFAKHLTKRDEKNIQHVLSTIESSYIKNTKDLFNQLIYEKKLIEMEPEEKLEILSIEELKSRFKFKKKIKKEIINEIIENYNLEEIKQRTGNKYYKLSKEYEEKYNELIREYENNSKIVFQNVITYIKNFDFEKILNVETKLLPTKNDLYNGTEHNISVIKVNTSHFDKKLREYEKIKMKAYLQNDSDEYVKNFKLYYFSQLINPSNEEKYREYFLKNKLPNIDYEHYNEKYFNYKRNIENQIFEKFIIFLNNKIATQLSIEELKNAGLEMEVWNTCYIHKDEKDKPDIENINKEIFCTCVIV